ncbi:cell division protein FtsZ [Candidatus Sumerlaeota bacterium]|nr:cell division protein FtsZ [Candidatus Sumerlaeota bacterium]
MGKIEFVEDAQIRTRIKVIGVGGGGSNAVDSMIELGLDGVDFCNINTDMQALALSACPTKLHIGDDVTHGMGCGGDPALGEKAALASKDRIQEALRECEMVFIAAGLGGGTGTGVAPVVAELAKSLGILTVAIVTKPFAFEGPQRQKRAEMGLAKLSEFVDTKIVILNDKLVEVVGPKTPIGEAFAMVNRVLAQGVSAINDLVQVPGQINVDFMDVRTIMGETGGAVMGVGVGKGENRATEAVKKACASPLQEKIVIEGARGVLISITGSPDISLQEVSAATQSVYEVADPEANIVFGLVINRDLKDEMRVTIIATGFPEESKRFPQRHPREEHLASPKTSLDLETKLKSMMSSSEPKPEAESPAPTAPSPSAASPTPPQAPPQPQPQSKPSVPPPASANAPRSAGQAELDRWSLPTLPPNAPEAPASPATPAEQKPEERKNGTDLDTPPYLRRKKTLFE